MVIILFHFVVCVLSCFDIPETGIYSIDYVLYFRCKVGENNLNKKSRVFLLAHKLEKLCITCLKIH